MVDDVKGDFDSLVRGILARDRLSAARLMRLVDDRADGYEQAMEALYPHTGHAHIVGIAGSPGCGKSTLADSLIEDYRARGRSVGVVAVDPSSSISGGAILGDRIRMQRHAADDGVFIRSLATRGTMGGLSSSTQDIARVMDALGCDVILVETVGTGQDEVDVAVVAQTSVIVLSPDTGDGIQMMKAGILEVGDVFVVNKADCAGADRVTAELKLFLNLHGADPQPAVVETVATSGEGVASLVEALEAHRARKDRKAGRSRLAGEIRRRLAERVISQSMQELEATMDEAIGAIEDGRSTPYEAVRMLYEKLRRM